MGPLAALLLALVSGCGAGHAQSERALAELEGLAFVPADRVLVDSFLVRVVLYENPRPLLVDRFELPRARWRAFAEERPEAVGALQRERMRAWPAGSSDWPATFMTLEEARACARWRSMRLMTSSEWLFCALGPERRQYPWDVYERRDSVANTLELGLQRPCPVGTFEGGRTPRGIYDLLGNVAEWVTDDVEARGEPEAALASPQSASALGGSFRSWSRPIFRPVASGDSGERPFLAFRLHPDSRQDDVGLRCAVEAEEFLWSQAPLWSSDRLTRSRLSAVGRSWGRAALPLLSELSERSGAPPGLGVLRAGAAE